MRRTVILLNNLKSTICSCHRWGPTDYASATLSTMGCQKHQAPCQHNRMEKMQSTLTASSYNYESYPVISHSENEDATYAAVRSNSNCYATA